MAGHPQGGVILGFDRLLALANAGFASGRYRVGAMTLDVETGTGLWPSLAPARLQAPAPPLSGPSRAIGCSPPLPERRPDVIPRAEDPARSRSRQAIADESKRVLGRALSPGAGRFASGGAVRTVFDRSSAASSATSRRRDGRTLRECNPQAAAAGASRLLARQPVVRKHRFRVGGRPRRRGPPMISNFVFFIRCLPRWLRSLPIPVHVINADLRVVRRTTTD